MQNSIEQFFVKKIYADHNDSALMNFFMEFYRILVDSITIPILPIANSNGPFALQLYHKRMELQLGFSFC
jgi:hypothetical protein